MPPAKPPVYNKKHSKKMVKKTVGAASWRKTSSSSSSEEDDIHMLPKTKTPHKCSECPYSAKRKFDLKKHYTSVHTDEKNFRCEECPYRSARKDNLDRHYTTMHGKSVKARKCVQLEQARGAAAAGYITPNNQNNLSVSSDEERDLLIKVKSLQDKNREYKSRLRKEEENKKQQIKIMRKTHGHNLQEKQDLINNLQHVIDEQETRIFEMEAEKRGQAVTRTKKPSSGIQKLVEQINRLQVERGSLQEQLLITQLNLEQAKLDAAGGQKFLQEKQQDQETKQHQAENDLIRMRSEQGATDHEKQVQRLEVANERLQREVNDLRTRVHNPSLEETSPSKVDRSELTTEATRGVLKQLLDKNVDEIRSRLGQRMAFGTAGLRSRVGMGFSQMNDLTILQTAQGFLRYLQEMFPDLQKTGLVIGYDSGHNSQRFAQLTAGIFLHAEVPVYLFSKICPTPFVPYSVRHLGCSAGVMVTITASRNRKEDNRYKIYWNNGSQITSAHDKGIASSIDANLEPWPTSWDVSICEQSPLCQDPMDRITKAYYQDIQNYCCHRENNQKTSVKFTYTAMHGVGYQFEVQAFQAFSLPSVIPVEEEIKPDPEKGKSVLDLSMETAEKHGSSVILANGPDADKLAMAEKQNGSWKVFTRNELGALLGWWTWQCWRQKNPDKDAKDVWMIASTTSSKIVRAIAMKESFNFEETLSGFKWMGNKADELTKKGQTVLLAFEEDVRGFMYGTNVLDKDGISASVVMAEMTCWLASQNISIKQQLSRIFEIYGYHTSDNSYYICHDPTTITKMFERMRNWDGKPGQYPSSCGPYRIKHIRDLTAGYDNSKPDNKPVLPTSKESQMITFSFENGCVATLRASRMEPKIQYYTEMCLPPGTGGSPESVAAELHAMVETMVKELLQPEVNGLIARV